MGKKKPIKKPSEDTYFKNIPGHYYDEKKRRLYKLAGNEFSKIQGVLTEEKLKAEEDEKKRLKDLTKFLKSKSHGTKSITHLHYLRQVRPKRSCQYRHEITSSIFSSLKCRGRLNATTFTKDYDNACIKRIMPGPSDSSLTVLAEGTFYHIVSLVNLNHTMNGLALEKPQFDPENVELENLNFSTFIKSSFFLKERVVDISWYAANESIIFANAAGFNEPSHIFLCRGADVVDLTLDKYIFSCAHSKTQMVAIGHEFGTDLYNISSIVDVHQVLKPIKTLNSNGCQVHSSTFSKEGNLLYYGDLKGHIRMFDLREKQVQNLIVLEQRARVDSFYECVDKNYVLTSLSDGRILMADMRTRKFVLGYNEHKNDYMKLPIHVNPTEEYIAAVGTDCYTRIWDFRTSRLLRTIPPPIPATRSKLPAVFFIPLMSHKFTSTMPGVFLSVEKDIFVYS